MENKVKKNKFKKSLYLDYKILLPYILLVSFGMMMIYSSTSYLQYLSPKNGTPMSYVIKQMMFLGMSIVGMVIIYKAKSKIFKNKGFMAISLLIVLGLLALTLVFGSKINGSRAWIKIGPISIQAVEYFKLMVVWYLAQILGRREDKKYHNFKEFFSINKAPLSFLTIGLVLLVLQPDFGGVMIICLMAFLMILVSGMYAKIAFSIFGGVIVLAIAGIKFISLVGDKLSFIPKFSHVYSRFAMYQNPFIDEKGAGHQLVNSYYAIANGGWFGRGLGNSIQKQGFLPEAHTDFVFAIVVEEFGVIGGTILLAVLFYLIIHLFIVAYKATDAFNSIMMYGIGGMILVQTFVNLGGVLGIIPMTGVTFPFISQGGNSLMVLSFGLAFALNISADEKRKKMEIPQENVAKPEHKLLSNKNVLNS